MRTPSGEEIWDSVTIQSREEGSELVIRVLVCHPGWDEPLQIACIRSQPKIDSQTSGMELLRCTLEHIQG